MSLDSLGLKNSHWTRDVPTRSCFHSFSSDKPLVVIQTCTQSSDDTGLMWEDSMVRKRCQGRQTLQASNSQLLKTKRILWNRKVTCLFRITSGRTFCANLSFTMEDLSVASVSSFGKTSSTWDISSWGECSSRFTIVEIVETRSPTSSTLMDCIKRGSSWKDHGEMKLPQYVGRQQQHDTTTNCTETYGGEFRKNSFNGNEFQMTRKCFQVKLLHFWKQNDSREKNSFHHSEQKLFSFFFCDVNVKSFSLKSDRRRRNRNRPGDSAESARRNAVCASRLCWRELSGWVDQGSPPTQFQSLEHRCLPESCRSNHQVTDKTKQLFQWKGTREQNYPIIPDANREISLMNEYPSAEKRTLQKRTSAM